MADDRVLLPGGPAADQAVAAWAADGVDVVRIFVQWDEVSPSPGAKKRARGRLRLLAHRRRGRSRPRRGHGADAHADRARAGVGDAGPVARQPPLPAVARRATRSSRATPWRTSRAACTATSCGTSRTSPSGWRRSPRRRRSTATSSTRPCRRSGRSTARRSCYVGALAPRARSRCRSCAGSAAWTARYRRVRTGRVPQLPPDLGHGARLPPALRHATRRCSPFPGANDANLASLGRLEAVLDRLRNAGRLRIGGSLWLDEYGYQTNPPDPFLGRVARHAGPLAAGGRLPDLAQSAGEAADAVRLAGRAGCARLGVLGLAVGPALCQRAPEAGAGALPGAVLRRREPRRAVGPGAPRRGASGARAAPHARRRRGRPWPASRPMRAATGCAASDFVRGASYRFVPADGATHASATRSAG